MKNEKMPKHAHGQERGGIKGSKKGIKHGHSGRHLHETEHNDRMENEQGSHPAFPSQGNEVQENSSY